jgi:hypothetical protein
MGSRTFETNPYMNRPRLIRALRINWTAFCGIACVLLVVLWVRSYWRTDVIEIRKSQYLFTIASANGKIALENFDMTNVKGDDFAWAEGGSWSYSSGSPLSPAAPGFPYLYYSRFVVPNWFAIVLLALLGTLPWQPWLRWRFTLRTLLVATTLVAIVLGLLVYATRTR